MLLLDEPASALDPIATASIEDLMHDLKHRYTIVIVTHNMQQAARVADRTAFFSLDATGADRTGTLIEYDDTEKIFRNPADLRTRDYVTGPLRLTTEFGSEDRLARDLLEDRLPALPAERRAAAVRRSARRARAGRSGLLEAQDPLDLGELCSRRPGAGPPA